MLEIQVLALDKHKNVSVLGPKPIQWQYINKQVIKKNYTYSLPLKKTGSVVLVRRFIGPKVH
jgi:hypothetical protein